MDLPRQVKRNAVFRARFEPGERLLLAVSGGVDSMVLLSLLQRLASAERWDLAVAHFNHELRGAESDGDERLARAAAAALGAPFYAGRGDVKAYRASHGVSLEMAARQLRHAFLAETAHQLGGVKIVTAHHADDQVELFFLRLFRGAGVDGLGGMDWLSPSPVDARLRIARPLLDVPKSCLEAYARANGVAFRLDASNHDPGILRNRVRAELLPWLAEHFTPSLPPTVARAMETLRAEGEVVDQLAANWLASPPVGGWKTLPLAVRRRCVLRQLLALGIAPEFELIESLCGLEAARANGPKGVRLRQDGEGGLRLLQPPESPPTVASLPVELVGESGEIQFGPWRIDWRRQPFEPDMRERREPGVERFDAARVGGRITLGFWAPGDRFQPLGLPGPVKLQDLFVNLKVAKDKRHITLVARAEDKGICWVQGFRIGDAYKLDKATRQVLTWRWRRLDA
jgi:tRNA(Ile)-lysidine synthase